MLTHLQARRKVHLWPLSTDLQDVVIIATLTFESLSTA